MLRTSGQWMYLNPEESFIKRLSVWLSTRFKRPYTAESKLACPTLQCTQANDVDEWGDDRRSADGLNPALPPA